MLEFIKNWDFNQFWSKISQITISQEFLKTDFGVNNWPILAPKGVKNSVVNGAIIYYQSLYKKYQF